MEKVITDNSSEKLTIKWDGERFALVQKQDTYPPIKVIILNPLEALQAAQFIIENTKEEK